MKIREVEFETIANLIAFLSVIVAICLLAKIGSKSAIDVAIMTGLIGVLGSFRPWVTGRKVEIDQPKGDPIPVTQTPAADTEGELPPEQKL